MVVVKISKRRIYIPKKLNFKGERAILIPFGKGLIVYPIPQQFVEVDIPYSISELKELAERKAKEDSLGTLTKVENKDSLWN
ncbi:MAG: hypothetical protein ACP6IU_14795 [Candidatus Asgardarchaeia archaeon]